MKLTVCCFHNFVFVVSVVYACLLVYLFTCFLLYFTGISVSFDMELYTVTEESADFISYLVINIDGQTEIDLLSSLIITFTDGSAISKSMNILISSMMYYIVYNISTGLSDYNALSGPYSIYVGNSTVRIPFTILSDTLDEGVESFNAQLSIDDSFTNRIVLGAIQNARVDISDDDGMLT